MDGGIFGLLRLIADHRGAVEYDLRHRFGFGLRAVGEDVTLSEVARLAMILRSDPSSAIASKLEGWDYPISREALAILDLYDVTVMANSDTKKGRPKPHPGRPMMIDTADHRRLGNRAGRSNEEIAELLRTHFGQPVAPV